jgi:hypothetical protein
VQASQVISHQSRQTISVWTLLCTRRHCHAETEKGLLINCRHIVGSTEWSRMSLYAIALRFPFTGTKGPELWKTAPDQYSSSTKIYHWHYALGQVAFSWHPYGDLRLVCGYSAMETHFMKLLTNSSCARGSLELGGECCNWGQTICTCYVLQHSTLQYIKWETLHTQWQGSPTGSPRVNL